MRGVQTLPRCAWQTALQPGVELAYQGLLRFNSGFMTRLFISYAREDIDFVRRLHEALVSQGLDTWVDWEGIPPAAEWLRKIELAVEAADAVVYVISPDSLESNVCQQEVVHAVRHHKRLLPAVLREPAPGTPAASAMTDAVRRLNWIFFNRPQDDFDKAAALVAKAARTDLAWVESHTRFLQRALEWQASGQDDSFLLVKTDLVAAEQWLAQAPDKDPPPAQVHSDYIVASRHAATRRQRRRMVAATVAAVLVGLGAVVATWQFVMAELQRQDSQSRQLAALAPAVLEQDPGLGMLLAAQALEVSATQEATSSLLAALDSAHGVSAFLPGRFMPPQLALAPDGTKVAAARCTRTDEDPCQGATVEVWQADPPRLLAATPLAMLPEQLAFTPDGLQLLVLACCGTAPPGAPAERRLMTLQWPAGTAVASAASATPAAAASTPAAATNAAGPAATVVADKPLAAGTALPAPFLDASALALQVQPAGKALRRLEVAGPIGFQPAGADAGGGASIRLLEGASPGRLLAQAALGTVDEVALRLRPDGAVAAAVSCELSPRTCYNSLAVIYAYAEEPSAATYRLPWPEWANDAVVLPGTPQVLSGGCGLHDGLRCRFGDLRLWSAESSADPQSPPPQVRVLGGSVRSMRLSADGHRLAVLGQDGVLSLWRLDTQGQRRHALEVPPAVQTNSAALQPASAGAGKPGSPSSRQLRCAGEDLSAQAALTQAAKLLNDPAALCSTVAEVDALLGNPDRNTLGPADTPLATTATPDGRRFAVGGCVDSQAGSGDCKRGRAAVWAVRDGLLDRVAGFDLPAGVQHVALSADGRTLAVAHCPQPRQGDCQDGRVERFKLDDSAAAPLLLANQQGGISALALSRDGALLAVARCARYGAAEGPGICAVARIEVRRTDAAALPPLWTGTGHDRGVDWLAFSPDASLLASGGSDGSVGLWSQRHGGAIGPVMQGPAGPAEGVRFADDGTLVFMPRNLQAPAMQVTRLAMQPAQWQKAACRMAVRTLNAAERQRYLQDANAPDACTPGGPGARQRLWRWLRGLMPGQG